RWRLAFRHVARDGGFVGAQVAEQRASVCESDLSQAPGSRERRRCNDRQQRADHRHADAVAEMGAAIERVTPAEARADAPSPIVAKHAAWEGDEATVVEEALIDEDTTIEDDAMVVDRATDAAVGEMTAADITGRGIG